MEARRLELLTFRVWGERSSRLSYASKSYQRILFYHNFPICQAVMKKSFFKLLPGCAYYVYRQQSESRKESEKRCRTSYLAARSRGEEREKCVEYAGLCCSVSALEWQCSFLYRKPFLHFFLWSDAWCWDTIYSAVRTCRPAAYKKTPESRVRPESLLRPDLIRPALQGRNVSRKYIHTSSGFRRLPLP